MPDKTKPTIFRSHPHNLDVVVQAGVPEAKNVHGQVIQERVPSIHAQFEHHMLETTDPNTIKYLRNHDLFNTPRGIWEDGNAPDEPKPTTRDQHKAIVKAASDRDTDALRDLIAAERETHNRPDIIETAEEAVANIEVPKAEAHGVVGRADEPAEDGDNVPKVDPAEPPKVEPEIEREKIIKSEEVAETRGETVPEGEEKVAAQIETERQATTAEETEKASPKKKATKKKKASPKKTQANAGQRTTASATSEGDASQSTAKDDDGDAGSRAD